MNRDFVHSTSLRSIGYDKDHNILEVEFKTGKVYQYLNVPLQLYEGLTNASSKGTFLRLYIQNARFRYRQI